MNPPSTPEVWAKAKTKITQAEIDRLLDGGIVSIGWTPPVSIRTSNGPEPIPTDLAGVRYDFRLEFAKDGAWYVDGKGPELRGWLPVEGPIFGPHPSQCALYRLEAMLLKICSPEGSS